MNQECVLLEGNHAPRVVAKLNGVEVNVILDTGFTPCIISYNLVKRLDLADQMIGLSSTENGGIMMVGDGRRVQTKGLIQKLQLELLPGHVKGVDALCLNVPDGAYDFLCVRVSMADFGFCEDLHTLSWFLRNGESLDDLEVYHNTAPEVGQEPNDCFLVTVLPIKSSLESEHETEKFTKLFSEIDANELLNAEQKGEIKQLMILQNSETFGVGYKYLTQTNLVKFHMDTNDAKPVYRRPYQNMSFSELKNLRLNIGEMLQVGTLIPAMHSNVEAPNSGWSFQVMYCIYLRRMEKNG